jgi:hypothetical protein
MAPNYFQVEYFQLKVTTDVSDFFVRIIQNKALEMKTNQHSLISEQRNILNNKYLECVFQKHPSDFFIFVAVN